MRKPNKIIPAFEDHERFFKFIKLNSESECWEWNGFIHDGYGRFNMKSSSGWLSFQSHRVSWSIFKSDPSPSLVIDHICRNRKCVNPEHLREVTAADNVIKNSESFIAYNVKKTHCPSGHEYSEENTRFSSKNGRYCLTCKREKIRLFRLRRK